MFKLISNSIIYSRKFLISLDENNLSKIIISKHQEIDFKYAYINLIFYISPLLPKSN